MEAAWVTVSRLNRSESWNVRIADDLWEAALYYHQFPKPGKLAIELTKPLVTQRYLSLAYSPGASFTSKPVTEGNPVLFKKCADIDVFDIELAENDPEKLIYIIVELASTLSSAPTPSGRDR